jgi:hypothetical protein
MLEFPRRPFPADIRSPPYVSFAIKNEYVPTSYLPFDIPLAMVLHFAPKTKIWLVQPPTDLPKSIKYLLLRKPIVGINIPHDISRGALATIIKRMLQLVGLTNRKEDFQVYPPSIIKQMKVMEAWKALDLPADGLRCLETHLLTRLALGDAVLFPEIRVLWDRFPRSSLILHEMAHNFIRSYINGQYSPDEGKMITMWIQAEKERMNFFSVFGQNICRDYSEVSTIVGPKSQKQAAPAKAIPSQLKRRSEILERDTTRRVSPLERKERERKDSMEMKRRLRRLRSDDSIRSLETVIYRPQTSSTAETTSKLEGQSNMREVSKGPKENFFFFFNTDFFSNSKRRKRANPPA